MAIKTREMEARKDLDATSREEDRSTFEKEGINAKDYLTREGGRGRENYYVL